jgi:carboxyl-terminal processing protease
MRKAILVFLFIPIHFHFLNAQILSDQVNKFDRVMDIINMFYVDTIQEDKLIEEAIISVLKELDPHSIYINKKEVKEMNEPLVGSFDGIGITYNLLRDTVYIISTFPGGPSERHGIKPGDRIISINNHQVAGVGINSDEVKKQLIGNEGSFVALEVKKKGQPYLASFSIPREQIPIYSIDASYKVNESTGYIKLNKFAANSLDEFINAAKKLKKSGIENLILDLRDNGGGYLRSAIDIADQFLSEKKMILYTMGTNSPKSEYFSDSKGMYEKSKIIILINESTASASEIVCGAVQDWDKALIVGRRSFGKGLVQRPFTLSDGSMIRLTIARYYTPTGRLIQKPYNDGFEKYTSDIKERIRHGEFYTADSIHFPDSLKFYTLEKHRKVYGGGGIMPDVFVPVDTLQYPKMYQKILKNGKLSEFVIDYIDKNREHINLEYPKFANFKKSFVVDVNLLESLMKFIQLQNLQLNFNDNVLVADKINASVDLNQKVEDFNLNSTNVKNHLKAIIAQNLYGSAEYYEILNSTDNTFLKAVEIISDENQYNSLLSRN